MTTVAGKIVRDPPLLDIVAIDDVTGARALNTSYQNLSNRVLRVDITVALTSTAVPEYAAAELRVGETDPPGAAECRAEARNDMAIAGTIRAQLSFEVPKNWWYRLQDTKQGGAAVAITDWHETQIG